MIIKFIIIIFCCYVLFRTYSRYRSKDITGRELAIWSVFWLLVAVAAAFPQKTDTAAQWLGVERGADLLVYISIVALFFIAFKIIVRLEKINRDITKIIREEALSKKKE